MPLRHYASLCKNTAAAVAVAPISCSPLHSQSHKFCHRIPLLCFMYTKAALFPAISTIFSRGPARQIASLSLDLRIVRDTRVAVVCQAQSSISVGQTMEGRWRWKVGGREGGRQEGRLSDGALSYYRARLSESCRRAAI